MTEGIHTVKHGEDGARLTPANEDYLEAIFELWEQSHGPVRSTDLAEALGVSKASVSNALGTLKAAGLVEQQTYGTITLTTAGAAYGSSVLERHKLLCDFLAGELGVSEDVAEREACAMEHAISDDTLSRWVAYLKVRRSGKDC